MAKQVLSNENGFIGIPLLALLVLGLIASQGRGAEPEMKVAVRDEVKAELMKPTVNSRDVVVIDRAELQRSIQVLFVNSLPALADKESNLVNTRDTRSAVAHNATDIAAKLGRQLASASGHLSSAKAAQ